MGKKKNKHKRGNQKNVSREVGNVFVMGSQDPLLLNKQISNSGSETLFHKNNAKSACSNLEVNNLETYVTNFKNPFAGMTNVSNNYGSRYLLEETKELRNGFVSEPTPKCIDLSDDDVPNQNEVIDLTETTVKSVNCDASEPIIIDISEEEPKANSESEEVCVLGTYLKSSQYPARLNNQVLNDRLSSIISCRKKTVVKNFLKLNTHYGTSKLKKKYKKMLKLHAKRRFLHNQAFQKRFKENLGDIGSNVYVQSPLSLPSSGLRPIIIDGSNVAYKHSSYNFCSKRLEICINYFKKKGHKVTAFVPQFRISSKKSDDPELLQKLEKQGYVVCTPSKEIDGRHVVPYDDRFIVQTAVLQGGIIVSRDNYKDLLNENPAWEQTIKYRTLGFTWVGDVLMFPEDPLGEFGPKLEEFLRFS